jgi:hypothetical protein
VLTAAALPNVAIPTGSSFPGSPSTGDRYRRSDLDYMVFLYDGTRWLSEQSWTVAPSTIALPTYSSTGPTATHRMAIPSALGLDVYITHWEVMVRVTTTNNGSNYYTFTLRENTSTDIDTLDTSALSADTISNLSGEVGSQRTNGTSVQLQFMYSKTGSPGAMDILTYLLHYSFIAT